MKRRRAEGQGLARLLRRNFCKGNCTNSLGTEFPGNLSKVHVFGPSGNMLYTTDSDGKDALTPATRSHVLMLLTVDICIQTPMNSLEEMHPLAETLHKRTYLSHNRARSRR